jgi:D-glycero-alpha-D-manno-heptose-7-phosphate kinase
VATFRLVLAWDRVPSSLWGLLSTLYALQGCIRTKAAVADEETRIEQEIIGESVGCQDQLWATYGSIGSISVATAESR